MKSRYDNEMELQFISKSRNEAFARITVAAFAAQLDPTIEELADIKTAVSEAVTNCIVHAYEDTEGIIKLRATLLDNVLEIEISDNGKGIEDVELARKPLYTTKGNLERSGMGFTIMESFMDEIEIHSVVGIGTKVVMKKRIKKEDNEIIEEEITEPTVRTEPLPLRRPPLPVLFSTIWTTASPAPPPAATPAEARSSTSTRPRRCRSFWSSPTASTTFRTSPSICAASMPSF